MYIVIVHCTAAPLFKHFVFHFHAALPFESHFEESRIICMEVALSLKMEEEIVIRRKVFDVMAASWKIK